MKIPDKSHRLKNLPLTAEHYECIGALCAHYSMFEMLTQIGLWHVLRVEPYRGVAFTAGMDAKRRMELIIELASTRRKESASVDALNAIHSEFTKKDGLASKRNDIVHGVWATDDGKEKAYPLAFKRSGKATFGGETTPESIEAVTRAVTVQGKALANVLRAWGCYPLDISMQRPASRKKPPARSLPRKHPQSKAPLGPRSRPPPSRA